MTDRLLITCEHGGNRVPARYRHMFRGRQRQLETHRGYDFGALVMAREIATRFSAPLIASTVTRLLVDLNRSVGHRDLHSNATRIQPRERRGEHVNDLPKQGRERVAQSGLESVTGARLQIAYRQPLPVVRERHRRLIHAIRAEPAHLTRLPVENAGAMHAHRIGCDRHRLAEEYCKEEKEFSKKQVRARVKGRYLNIGIWILIFRPSKS